MKKILFVGSEAMPFAATGGLGDVMGSLPTAIRAADGDCDVRVVMPLYSSISEELKEKMTFICSITGLCPDGISWAPAGVDEYARAVAVESAKNAIERPLEITRSVL